MRSSMVGAAWLWPTKHVRASHTGAVVNRIRVVAQSTQAPSMVAPGETSHLREICVEEDVTVFVIAGVPEQSFVSIDAVKISHLDRPQRGRPFALVAAVIQGVNLPALG